MECGARVSQVVFNSNRFGGSSFVRRRFVGAKNKVAILRRGKPDFAILEIVEQFFVLRLAQFTRPEDFCAINIRTVENPFIVDAEIVFIVADHYEMLAGFGLEFLQNERSAYVTGAGPIERIALFVNGGRDRAEKKQNDGTASERLAPRKARSTHGSQMAQGLDDERENETCNGRCIMRIGPDDEVDCEDDESEGNPQCAKLAIAQCKRNARYGLF